MLRSYKHTETVEEEEHEVLWFRILQGIVE